MSHILQKLLQARAEPCQEAQWPQWIADALACKPERAALVLDSPREAVPPEASERRDIRY